MKSLEKINWSVPDNISVYNKKNLFIWAVMAFQAGLLNTGGFFACHTFVSHVTGYATLFGVRFQEQDLFNAAALLTVPLFFLFGSILSGFLIDLRLQLRKRPKYYLVFGVLFFLTLFIFLGGILSLFGEFGEPLELTRDYVLLSLLCLVCGIQNGAVTTVSRSVIRTTHLTGITTDLGLGIVRILNRSKLPKHFIQHEQKANLARIAIILFFGIGSVLGAYLFYNWQYLGFLIPVLIYGLLFLDSFKLPFIKKTLFDP